MKNIAQIYPEKMWYIGRLRYTFNSRLWHHLGHHISPTGLLHELPPHSSSSNIAGTSCVSPNLDNISWKASVLWSNLVGQTFPISLITRWCRNEWMYEDVSVTFHMSCPSEMIRSLLLIMPFAGVVWKRMVISNFDVWCSMMKNTSRIWDTDTYCAIPLLLSIGTVQGSSDICILPVQIQRRHIYLLLCHHNSSSCDLVLLMTHFSAQTLEQMHLSTRLH